MNFASASLKGAMERDLHEHLYEVISSEWFLERRGLNNEVPFFICPFQPAYSGEMKRVTSQLKNRLGQKGVEVLEVNLFELSIELHDLNKGLPSRLFHIAIFETQQAIQLRAQHPLKLWVRLCFQSRAPCEAHFHILAGERPALCATATSASSSAVVHSPAGLDQS